MKRTLVLLGSLAALAVAAAPASAAGWTGVVVAKDGSRDAVVTASADGTVRTARSSKAASLRIGQRLSVGGTKLADGTYRAASVRVTGRASTTRLKAVVIRNQRAQKRLLVSAGGSTFALARRSAARTLAARAGGEPKPGDQIVATVSVASGTPQAIAVTTLGHLGTLKVEGIVTKITDGSIELIVAKAGYVTIAIPAGFDLPVGLKAFDKLRLTVAVATDGKLTALAAKAEDDGNDHDEDEDKDEDSREVEVKGTITALSTTSITVQRASSTSPVTCALAAPLTGFAVGNAVEVKCVAGATGALTLKRIELEDDKGSNDDDRDEVELKGTITALSATSITVTRGSTTKPPVTCALTKALTRAAVGDKVELKCVEDAAGVLTLKKLELQDDEDRDEDEDEGDEDDDDNDDDEDEDEDDNDD